MTKLNIRVYKTIFPNGEITFEMKDGEVREAIGCSTIKRLASMVNDLTKNNTTNIDLKPYHDIEYTPGLSPRRCLSLTKKESDEFWIHFSNISR